MNTRPLLVMSMVTVLALGLVAANSYAKDDAGMTPSAPAMSGMMGMHGMQGNVSQPADSEEFHGWGHHRHSLEAMMKKLGITDDQKKQIRALYVGFEDRTRKARSELFSLKDEKKTMVLSGKIDQAKLAQIDEQIVKLVSDVMRERFKLQRDRLALMTPEQLDKIATWKAEKAFHKKMKWSHGGHHGMHEGGF